MSRRFQFSLRYLLVVFLVVGAFFGGIAIEKRLTREQLAQERALLDERQAVLENGEAWLSMKEKRMAFERFGTISLPDIPVRVMPQATPLRCPICGKVHEARTHK
jgi:Tfp pilus assembly protein PilX